MGIPGTLEITLMLVWAAITIIPFWKIFSKAGYNGAWSIPMVIPIVGTVLLFYLAFSKWPIERR